MTTGLSARQPISSPITPHRYAVRGLRTSSATMSSAGVGALAEDAIQKDRDIGSKPLLRRKPATGGLCFVGRRLHCLDRHPHDRVVETILAAEVIVHRRDVGPRLLADLPDGHFREAALGKETRRRIQHA